MDILTNKLLMDRIKKAKLQVDKLKDLTRKDEIGISLSIGGKELLLWGILQGFRPNINKTVNDFNLLIGNECKKKLSLINLYDYIKNLNEIVQNPFIRPDLVDINEKILVNQQLCVISQKDSDIEFSIKLQMENSNGLIEEKNKSGYIVITSTSVGTSTQLVTDNDILYFNDNSNGKTYKIKQNEFVVKLQDFVSTPITEIKEISEINSNNQIYVFLIPITQTIKIYRQTKKKIYNLSENFNIKTNLSPGYVKSSFKSTNCMGLKRDKNKPIKCIIQHYFLSNSDELTEKHLELIYQKLNNNIKDFSFGSKKQIQTQPVEFDLLSMDSQPEQSNNSHQFDNIPHDLFNNNPPNPFDIFDDLSSFNQPTMNALSINNQNTPIQLPEYQNSINEHQINTNTLLKSNSFFDNNFNFDDSNVNWDEISLNSNNSKSIKPIEKNKKISLVDELISIFSP
jgi:hypothetical protein